MNNDPVDLNALRRKLRELALLPDGARRETLLQVVARVLSHVDVDVLVATRAEFEQMLADHPSAAPEVRDLVPEIILLIDGQIELRRLQS